MSRQEPQLGQCKSSIATWTPLQQRLGAQHQGDGCFGGGGDGGEVSHFAAGAGAEFFVEVEADSGDGEGAVEVGGAGGGGRLSVRRCPFSVGDRGGICA